MLRLEADPPCGFCTYGGRKRKKKDEGGGKLGDAVRDQVVTKNQKGREISVV